MSPNKYECILCTARKDDVGPDNAYFENCDACTDVDTCTSCTAGFIRYNSKGCILHCKDDHEFGTNPSYEASNGKNCVESCKNDDNGNSINTLGTACVSDCATEAYKDTSGADNVCILCETPMPDCIKCTAANVCTECEGAHFLKVSKSGCVSSCTTDDSSLAKSGGVNECTSACEDNEYSNGGTCEACDTSATMTDCIKCTSSTNCL